MAAAVAAGHGCEGIAADFPYYSAGVHIHGDQPIRPGEEHTAIHHDRRRRPDVAVEIHVSASGQTSRPEHAQRHFEMIVGLERIGSVSPFVRPVI